MSENVTTLDEDLDNAKNSFKKKFDEEIEHIRRVHPVTRRAVTVIRVEEGAMLAVYDFDRLDSEPVYFVGINPGDWALLVTALPNRGLAVPLFTWPEIEARIVVGITADHEVKVA